MGIRGEDWTQLLGSTGNDNGRGLIRMRGQPPDSPQVAVLVDEAHRSHADKEPFFGCWWFLVVFGFCFLCFLVVVGGLWFLVFGGFWFLVVVLFCFVPCWCFLVVGFWFLLFVNVFWM